MIKRNLNVFIVLFGLAQSTQALAIHFPIAEPIGAALAGVDDNQAIPF